MHQKYILENQSEDHPSSFPQNAVDDGEEACHV
jgi:hypothetical protein